MIEVVWFRIQHFGINFFKRELKPLENYKIFVRKKDQIAKFFYAFENLLEGKICKKSSIGLKNLRSDKIFYNFLEV